MIMGGIFEICSCELNILYVSGDEKLQCSAPVTIVDAVLVHMQPFLLRQYLGSLGQNRQKVFASVMKLIQDGVIELPSGAFHFPL
jgi:hypothetical protein